MTFSYTVTNEGPNQVWAGTQYWTDFIWLSTDTTFVRTRASFLGQTTHDQDRPLQPGQSYTVTYTVTLPPGTGGQYYLYIDLDAHNDLPPALYTYTARLETTDWWPADTGDNSYWLGEFDHWAFEDPDNNRIATPMTIIYSEPDLKVTNITVPSGVVSGTTIPITYTVTNQGTRATRTATGPTRIFLSQDASLDTGDTELGTAGYGQVLAAGRLVHRDGRRPRPRRHPGDLRHPGVRRLGRVHRLLSAEQHRLRPLRHRDRRAPTSWTPTTWSPSAIRSLGRGHVPQYENEADKLASVADARDPGPGPRLAGDRHQHRRERGPRRAGPDARRHLHRHQRRRRHAADESTWDDLIYFSAGTTLELKTDTYLGMTTHENGLAAGASYTVTTQVQVPTNLSGPYYLFVITDPPTDSPIGKVFEGGGANEDNNSLYLAPPLIIDPPPPSNLAVTSITLPSPATAKSGDPVTVSWTVQDTSATNPAPGTWSDAVYLATGTTWDISDVYLGTVQHTGTLQPGDSYTGTLTFDMPSVTPGQYHIIVRADIFDQIALPAGVPISSKTTASAGLLTVAVDGLTLGVPYATTLSDGQERLLQVTVPQGATLEVSLTSNASGAANEIYIKQGAAPTDSVYDAAYQGGAGPRPGCDHPVHRAGRVLRADRRQFRAGRRHAGHRPGAVAPAVDHGRADRPGRRQPVRHHHDQRRPVPAQCDRQAGHARLRRIPAGHSPTSSTAPRSSPSST